MKTKKEKNITVMNVWDFKKSYAAVFNPNEKIIIDGINKDGFFMVEAGKQDLLKLTY